MTWAWIMHAFLKMDIQHKPAFCWKDKADVPVCIERIEGGFTVKLKA
jgi:hypothetical protein